MLSSFHKDPRSFFAIGLAVVLLSIAVPVLPNYRTFVHMWQVETVASAFLLLTICFVVFSRRYSGYALQFSRVEVIFVLVPMAAFAAWSGSSALWANSPRSALHHTLVWLLYLTFYVIARLILNAEGVYKRLIPAVTLVLVFVSVLAIVEYASILVLGGGSSIGLRFARYGEQVNTILPLVIGGVLVLKGRSFYLGLIGLGSLWLLVFASLGRTNIALFAGTTLAIALCVFVFKRFHKHRLRMVVIVLLLIAAPIPLQMFSVFSGDPNIPILRRVNDESAISGSNGFRKLMASVAIEMFSANPVLGVGADNFGLEVNKYRAEYSAKYPGDTNLANAENEIPERTHNEYLQIIAELGIVGGLLFVWFLIGLGLMALRALRQRPPLTAIASIIGVFVFLASSLVTSYSFRLMQNGLIFFLVLAVAAKYLFRTPLDRKHAEFRISRKPLLALCGAAAFGCVVLIGYHGLRVVSVVVAANANSVADLDRAIREYNRAVTLDPENPDAEFDVGMRLFEADRFDEAALHLERSIAKGRGPSVSFSYLATAQLMAARPAEASNTFGQAVRLYPRSTFVLTRYAFLLKQAGDSGASEQELARASAIDPAAAKTWWLLMTEGSKLTAEAVKADKSMAEIMDLTPNPAIYAVLNERGALFPAEKSAFDFMK